MPHWTEERKGLSTEVRETLSKFDTEDAAFTGYHDLQKSAGKPFKLPETMAAVDHWPDEKDRDAFHGGMKALRGGIKSADDLKDVNFAEGLADARMVNEDLKKGFIDLMVKKGYTKEDVQDIVKMANGINQQSLNTQRSAIEKTETEELEKINTGLEALYGGKTGVDRCKENVRKFFLNRCGLTGEEYEQAGEEILKRITTSLPLSKALFNVAERFKEGTTEQGGGPKPTEGESTISEQMPGTAKVLDWKK